MASEPARMIDPIVRELLATSLGYLVLGIAEVELDEPQSAIPLLRRAEMNLKRAAEWKQRTPISKARERT